MKIKLSLISIIIIILSSSQSYSSDRIAKVIKFEGEVIIHTGSKIINVEKKGQPVNKGDRIQTKKGTVELKFKDRAVIKINPYTSMMIQEKEEVRGAWIFKEKIDVRRITCFVGKLWFKSGASKRKNYLQTPTAVCGVRGSDGDIGYDNTYTYLNMYTGNAKTVGNVKRGAFDDPGMNAVESSNVYRVMSVAHENSENAKKSGKALDQARSRVDVLKVIKIASNELNKNPEDVVKADARITGVAADATLAAAKTSVHVEKLKVALIEAETAVGKAKAAGNDEAFSKAIEAAATIVTAVTELESIKQTAEKSAQEAQAAAENGDFEKAKEAADAAQQVVLEGESIVENLSETIDESVPVTIEPSTEPEDNIINEILLEQKEQIEQDTEESPGIPPPDDDDRADVEVVPPSDRSPSQ